MTWYSFFFFNDTATTEIYTLSLHDALPICPSGRPRRARRPASGWSRHRLRCLAKVHGVAAGRADGTDQQDRKSTRLNSSHANISYAVFCLKKKKNKQHPQLLLSIFNQLHPS